LADESNSLNLNVLWPSAITAADKTNDVATVNTAILLLNIDCLKNSVQSLL